MRAIAPSGSTPAASPSSLEAQLGHDPATPSFSSLLVIDSRASSFSKTRTQGAAGPLISPADPFDALGVFGRTAFAASGDGPRIALAEIEEAGPPELPNTSFGTPPDTSVALPPGGCFEGVSAVVDTQNGSSRLVNRIHLALADGALPDVNAPLVAKDCSDEGSTGQETQASSRRATQRLPQASAEPDAVSLTVAGEDQALQIVARTNADDPDHREAIRRLADQVAAEFGMTVESLHLDGRPTPRSNISLGGSYGR